MVRQGSQSLVACMSSSRFSAEFSRTSRGGGDDGNILVLFMIGVQRLSCSEETKKVMLMDGTKL